jgi:hypothetical protein
MDRTADFSSFTQTSLVLASLDIGRVLADRDGVTFRAQGTCMHPTVRPGDVLRIQSRAAAQADIGDIAVCRGDGFLFSHRVIAKGERDGRSFIVTRPDRTEVGSDAPTFDDDLLGVVIAITRNGKPVSLVPTAYPWLRRRYYVVTLALIESAQLAQLWLVNGVERMQNRSLYRNIARGWFALLRPRVSYAVRMQLNSKLGNAVYHQFAPDEFDARGTWAGRAVERWTLALHLNDEREPSAWATFVRGMADAWRVEDSYVRLRYRGVGLDYRLLRQAEVILAKGGYQISANQPSKENSTGQEALAQ